MKTSKIKTIHSCKEFASQTGTIYYHCLTMDNADEINIGKKKQQAVGDELTYELVGGDDGQQRFKKAKTAQKDNFKGGFVPKDQDAILYQTCLKIAGEFLISNPTNFTPEAVNEEAFRMAQIAKKNIELLKS